MTRSTNRCYSHAITTGIKLPGTTGNPIYPIPDRQAPPPEDPRPLAMQQSWTAAFTNPHADPRSHHPLRAIPYRLSDSPAHPPKKRIAEATSSAFPLRPGECKSLSLGNSSLTSLPLTKVCINESRRFRHSAPQQQENKKLEKNNKIRP